MKKATSAAKAAPVKVAPATKVAPAKKTASAKKVAPAAPATVVNVDPAPAVVAAPATKVAPVKVKRDVDKYGCRPGTKVHDAMKLFETGKYTMAEVKEKLGTTFRKKLKHLKEEGFTIEVTDFKIKLSGKLQL